MSTFAFIPLRGGSKSIPRKNILAIAGKPLCRWVIEAAAGAERIDHVFVATDSDEISRVISAWGLAKVSVIGRSPETATDTASTESAMLEFAGGRTFDRMVLIQATSPLLESRDLDAALAHFEEERADSLVSVVAQKRFIWSVAADGVAVPQNYEPVRRPRRQDFSPYFVENGAFYVSKREGLLETGSRLFGKIVAHEMAEQTFHELDEPVDWKIIEGFLLDRTKGVSAEPDELVRRAQRIRLVLSDVDGVLTDSGMYYSEAGDELKKFNTRDGKGFELLRLAGLKVGIITSEQTALVERRAKKLQLDFLEQGAREKMPALDRILEASGLSADQVAFVGDDLADVPVLARVGFAACPADATPEAVARSHYVAKKRGGEGCVREIAEYLLAVQAR